MIKKNSDVGLRGSLNLTNVSDLLQFLEASGKNGALGLSQGIGGKKARVYFVSGQIAHAVSGEQDGLPALADVIGWNAGEFNFAPDVDPPRETVDMPLQFALLEAARIRDEHLRARGSNARQSRRAKSSIPPKDLLEEDFDFEGVDTTNNESARTSAVPGRSESEAATEEGLENESERSNEMGYQPRSSSDVLEDLLKVPGIDAVVVVGRDGFVIESSGSSSRMNIDALGAALAHAINGIEEMGGELHIDDFSDLFIEYGRAVLLCRPVGEAIAVLVTPDASKLGIIRHKAKALFQELGGLF